MPKIRFAAVLRSTASRGAPGGVAITMPRGASARLGTRAHVNVKGTINGHPFRNSMFPGQTCHTRPLITPGEHDGSN